MVPGARASSVLASPGIRWGRYPQRPEAASHALRRSWSELTLGSHEALLQRINEEVRRAASSWHRLSEKELAHATGRLASRLRRDGLQKHRVVQALACVETYLRRSMGLEAFESQIMCAAALLDQRLAEMATGEGKTVAAAMAAAVCGLAGAPVHVLTANEYLAQRDHLEMAPLFEAFGFTHGCVSYDQPELQRREAYGVQILYSTAKTIAFDYLRDRLVLQDSASDIQVRARLASGEAQPFLQGLCVAIVDEADSVLIDEAKTPLIISEGRPDAAMRAQVWQALDMAKRLSASHFKVQAHERRVLLLPPGAERLAEISMDYGDAWGNRLWREDLVSQCLTALHALQRDRDYLVQDGEIVIIDPLTGRAAIGRQWSRQLHGAVALKEGQPMPLTTTTQARITYPRLFSRYHHLSGLSGTLREVRWELRRSYGLGLCTIPRHRPLQRKQWPTRVFHDLASCEQALVTELGRLTGAGRAVLLTVDTVAQASTLTERLGQAGIACQLLHAGTAAQEAQIVAAAGQQARVTVATQLAGRGTDIKPSEQVLQAGGLHVLNLQNNRNRRQDRQIIGRSGRQGQPGSAQRWIVLNPDTLAQWPLGLHWAVPWARRLAVLPWLVALAQRALEREDAQIRRSSLRADRQWARALHFSQVIE
jgi:preprotein translocase subunit SecA